MQSEGALSALLSFAQPALAEPVAPDRNRKPIKVGEAYYREFERFLVRMYLERQPAMVATHLQRTDTGLSAEQRLFATLALEPKAGAMVLAAILPTLDRAPTSEELLSLAQAAEVPACADAIRALLRKPSVRAEVAEGLLSARTKLDPAKVGPLLTDAAQELLTGDGKTQALGIALIGGFQLAALEAELVKFTQQAQDVSTLSNALQALRDLRSSEVDLFVGFSTHADPTVVDRALAALTASRAPQAPGAALNLLSKLDVLRRRAVLGGLSSSKEGARAIAAALQAKSLAKEEIDGPIAEKLALTLGESPELKALMAELGTVFRPVLMLDGSDGAVTETKLDLKGPFTLEFWVRLAPGIDNNDGVLGSQGQLDINFAGSLLRLYAFAPLGDVLVAKKPITPELWTHYAITRDAKGELRLYGNGELESVGKVPVAKDFLGCNVAWTVPKLGTKGALAEYRVWNVARSAKEIRDNFTRTFAGEERPAALAFFNAGGDASWGALRKGAQVVRTTDAPPLITKAQFEVLARKQERYMELGGKGGNVAKGKALAAMCQTCHVINGLGGQIGPNLSGAGAMGLEGVIRNIMDPNAAMEAAYRVFRLELISGEVLEGFYVSEDAKAYVLRQPGGEEIRTPKSNVRSARYLRRSLMPEGLLDALGDEQVSDLLAYLMTLK
jgi:putative heme-binding domain-containing protein